MTARLSLTGVQKSFGATKVLHGVAQSVRPGEVHGLLGENGGGDRDDPSGIAAGAGTD